MKHYNKNVILYFDKNRTKINIATIIYILLLNFIYIFKISTIYSYLGFSFNSPNVIWLIIYSLIAFIPTSFLPRENHRPSELLILFLYLAVYIPSCYIPIYSLLYPPHILLIHMLTLLASLLIMLFSSQLPILKIPEIKINKKLVLKFAVIITCVFLILIFFKLKSYISWVNLYDIYPKRAVIASFLSNKIIYNYLIHWCAATLLPFFLAYGLINKNSKLILLGVVGSVFLYTINPYKSVLITSAYILIIYTFLQYSHSKNRIFLFITAINTLLITAFCIDFLCNSHILTGLFIRRIFITPGLLTGWYWYFFDAHPFVFLSNSIFKHLISYPYQHRITFEVGHYFLNSYFDANANIWASAYADFGDIGMLLFSVIISGYLWIYDSITQKLHKNILPSILILVMAINFSNSALFTCLFTHGALFSLLLLYLIKSDEK